MYIRNYSILLITEIEANMTKFGAWKTMYGARGKELASVMDQESYTKARAEFLNSERERMRLVMRERRQRVKAENLERLKASHGQLPDWPDSLLNHVERWIGANSSEFAATPLVEVESAVRKYCRLAGVADYERVTSHGLARYFRAIGLAVVRRSDGMYVRGIYLK
jgi:hypothetical protein